VLCCVLELTAEIECHGLYKFLFEFRYQFLDVVDVEWFAFWQADYPAEFVTASDPFVQIADGVAKLETPKGQVSVRVNPVRVFLSREDGISNRIAGRACQRAVTTVLPASWVLERMLWPPSHDNINR
jgi:hypothetical protein